jgi:hypothetical protein
MALPKWFEDILASEGIKNLVKLAVVTFAMWLVAHFQTAEINERVKKSENLVQETVEEQVGEVVSAVMEVQAAEPQSP